MQKQITSTLLVAGMCIGGGTIAIPMVLAKLGIIPSAIITLLVWFLNYYPSLAGMELNLRSERGLSLGALGKVFRSWGSNCGRNQRESFILCCAYNVSLWSLFNSPKIIRGLFSMRSFYCND